MGKLCSACHEDLSKSKFSRRQWTAEQTQRRCKECSAHNLPSVPFPENREEDAGAAPSGAETSRFQLGAPVEYIDVERAKRKLASLAPGDEEIRCYVCLEGSTEEQPLVRDCGCRGSAGWAHYSCLADYSTLRLSTIFEDHLSGRAGIGVSSEIEETWTKCKNCMQVYRNDLLLATSAGYMDFVQNKDLADRDKHVKGCLVLEAGKSLLCGLIASVDPKRNSYLDDAKKLAKEILGDWLPKSQHNPLLFQQYRLEYEADIYGKVLSYFAESDGDDKAALRYLKHAIHLFERLRSGQIPLHYQQDYEAQIAIVQAYVDEAEERLNSDSEEINEAEREEKSRLELEKSRYRYELAKRDAGASSSRAIDAGVIYAYSLWESGSILKAQRLVTEMHANSKRIFGEDYWSTKRAREAREQIAQRRVGVVSAHGNDETGLLCFNVIRYKPEIDSYLLQAPSEREDDEDKSGEDRHDVEGERRMDPYREYCDKPGNSYAPRDMCALEPSTPVIVSGLPPGSEEDLNGKIGEIREWEFTCSNDASRPISLMKSYTIRFEATGIERRVSARNVFILFDLPLE